MELKIRINKYVYYAQLLENAFEKVAAICPLSETFVKSGNHEYYCRLLGGLETDGLKCTSRVHRNGIYYFSAWNALSFVYRDADISPYQVLYLGNVQESMSRLLDTAENKILVHLEVSK